MTLMTDYIKYPPPLSLSLALPLSLSVYISPFTKLYCDIGQKI